MIPAGRGGRRLRPEFILVAAIFLALGILRLNDLFLYTPDGARYLIWGNSIARGEGYLDATQPEPLRYVVHAPLYAALLAPVELFFPMAVVPAKAWTLAWGLLALALLYLWLDRTAGRAGAFAGTAMLAFNPGFLVFATEVMSEAPFTAFLLASVILTTKAASGGGLARREWILLAAAASTIGLLREVGVAVTLCVVVALWRADRRKAIAVAVLAGACLGLWHLRNAVFVGAPPGSPGSNLALALGGFSGGEGGAGAWEILRGAASSLSAYVVRACGMAFYPLYGPQHSLLLESPVPVPPALAWAVTLVVGSLVVTGAVRSARNVAGGWIPLAAAGGILAAASVYPVHDPRFTAPVLPIAIACLVSALVPARPGGRWRRPALFAATAIVVAPNVPAVADLLSLNARYHRSTLELHSALAGREDAPEYYLRPWSLLGDWIDSNLPAGALIATPAKELAAVSGGRKVVELDPGVPQALFDRILRGNGVTHLLAPVRWGDVVTYEALIGGSRRIAFTEIFRAGNLRLFEVRPGSFDDGEAAGAHRTRAGAPAGAGWFLRAARAAIAAGRYDDATALIDSAAATAHGRVEVRFERLVAAAMSGDSAGARAAFAALTELPQVASWFAPARNHLRLAEEVAAATALPPGAERSMRALDASRAYWEMGYYERARRLLGEEARKDTGFFVGQLWNFHYNFQLGDTAAAGRSLSLLDRIDSTNSLVRNFHSLVDLRRRVRSAADPADRAADRLRMAKIYRDIELFDEAFDEGAASLRDDPRQAAAARFLGDLSLQRESGRRALAYYRAALEASPGDDALRAIVDSLSAPAAR